MIHRQMTASLRSYFIVSRGTHWKPGRYATERAARYAYLFPDDRLQELQAGAEALTGYGATITVGDLRRCAAAMKRERSAA